MLQDPNVERVIKNYTEPLQKQISMLQIELGAIKQQCNIANVVESKPNEKAALKHAVESIYFADNSDYLSGLYGVVRSLTGLDEPTEDDIKKLFKELNPE